MDSYQSTDRSRWSLRLAVTIWSSLLLGGWLLAARSAAGELSASLSPVYGWTVTGSVAVLGLLAGIIHRLGASPTSAAPRPLIVTLTLAPLLTAGLVLVDLSGPVAWAGFVAIVLATTLVLYRDSLRHRLVRTPPTPASSPALDSFVAPTQPVPDLSQTLRRQRDSDGDRLDGDLTVHWQNGQRQQLVHVPFVPSFEEVPDVSCTCEDDPSDGQVRARVAEVQRFGARIELRRSGQAENRQATRLGLSVTLDDSAQRAA